jgi:hypothetical protein
MRTLVAAVPLLALSLLGFSLLGGCAQPRYLLSERTDPAPAATTSSLRDVPARYTNHAPSAAKTEIISLHIGEALTEDENAQIVAAVGEWNHVLNGAVRFDFSPAAAIRYDFSPTAGSPAQPEVWLVTLAKTPWEISEQNNPQSLATTLRLPSGGGLIIVYASRLYDERLIGDHSLRGIMVHELGVALGGGNDPSLYTAHVQDCIDKNMAMSVGSIRNLPTAQLNWCRADGKVASADE